MKLFGSVVIRIIISFILGILPSFLLFSVFHQSNFSPLEYVTFLLEPTASLVSWASIIVIAMIVYLLLTTIQSKKKKAFALFFVVFLSLAFVVLYLYANFLLGNDILVKLSADKENLFLSNVTEQSLTFTISTFMNPFCLAQCDYSFFDISTGKVIDAGNFSTTSILSTSKEYIFTREGHLQGQELNRFELTCKSQKTVLCYTTEEESKRAMLVTLNYDISPEQKIANEFSKKEFVSLERTIYNLSNKLNETDLKIKAMNGSILIDSFILKNSNLSEKFPTLNTSFESAKQLWNAQEYTLFETKLTILKEEINNFSAEENKLAFLINSNISLYNELILNLSDSRTEIKQIPLVNISEDLCAGLNNLISNFNQTIDKFKERSNLSYKEMLVENISLEVKRIYKGLEENINVPCVLTNRISEENLSKINVSIFNYTIPEFYLEDPLPLCCFYGKCEVCLNETYSNKNYPVIFLHGHSLNKDLSADYSLDAFEKIKSKLIGQGYIDAGAVIISESGEQAGLWGKINASMEITGSYFFDVSKSETGEETIISSKTEGIDTYSIRLDGIIKTMKARTGKDKVILVAHSMGGLVTRRYIQVFGEKDVDRIILVTVPNHGIENDLKNYCSLIGSKKECSDMDKTSLLINKLDNGQNITIPVYNLIGMGCKMGNENGDGILKESTQYLNYADNFYVEGFCNELGFDFLHKAILNPDKYPQAYEFIKEALKENSTKQEIK